jgi:hypothetical protein
MTDDVKTAGKKLAKGAATLAVAAVAVYGAVKPEEKARQAIVANTISHKALAKKVEELQTWVQSNRETAAGASAACRAKVEALSSFVSGYLVALNRPTNGRRRGTTDTPQEIKALVKALSGKRPRTAQKALPKLKPAPAAPAF